MRAHDSHRLAPLAIDAADRDPPGPEFIACMRERFQVEREMDLIAPPQRPTRPCAARWKAPRSRMRSAGSRCSAPGSRRWASISNGRRFRRWRMHSGLQADAALGNTVHAHATVPQLDQPVALQHPQLRVHALA